jgi:hypothetical protein
LGFDRSSNLCRGVLALAEAVEILKLSPTWDFSAARCPGVRSLARIRGTVRRVPCKTSAFEQEMRNSGDLDE